MAFRHSGCLPHTDRVPDDLPERRLFRSEPEGQARDRSALVSRQHVLLGKRDPVLGAGTPGTSGRL